MTEVRLKIKDHDWGVTHNITARGETESVARVNGLARIMDITGSKNIEIVSCERVGKLKT